MKVTLLTRINTIESHRLLPTFVNVHTGCACTLPVKKSSAAKKNWVPPTGLNYKENVDGAVFSAQKTAGVGVVIRDNECHFIAGLSKKLNLPLGAIETEATTVEVGITFAGEIGIRDFVLEGDSLIMIQALSDSALAPSSVASLVYGIAVAAYDFRSVKFSHVCRNGNILAHLLAKHALGIVDYCDWNEKSSCFIEQALLHDVSMAFTN
ncbi:uncharacterized protein LOC126696773 [Quercus robur]|uniref:uncharacterized protein LOC126696773 n=1 Tax=Quercus robur TaxID=38942 RepID=UPI002163EFB4|nr:uncharacterized protein LOC126696773 [Quercus robur]